MALRIFAADGPGGAPGTLLWADESLTISRGRWNAIPVGIELTRTPFYIFYIQSGIYPYCPAVCTDVAENAGAGRRWQYTPGGGFVPDSRRGDWLIRAVVNWGPPQNAVAVERFATALPRDTDPGTQLPVGIVLRPLGRDSLPAGTGIHLRITGPLGYAFAFDTTLSLSLPRTRCPVDLGHWSAPDTPGSYTFTVWVSSDGDTWQSDDTLHWQLGLSNWVNYASFAPSRYWLHWARERAVRFNPADFGLIWPLQISRLRAVFSSDGPPWRDSSFRFRIYAADGGTLLHESDRLRALPGRPGPPVVCDLDSVVTVVSGDFWVSVVPTDTSGLPGSVADDNPRGHSFYRDSTVWQNLTVGEYLIAASVQGRTALTEPYPKPVPGIRIVIRPNPARSKTAIVWPGQDVMMNRITVCDAAGRSVLALGPEELQPGRAEVSVGHLVPGCYFVRLETRTGTVRRPLVIFR